MPIVCYFLCNETGRLTYKGYSTNLDRRLRQHRGYISGGAKYTKRFKSCRVICYISGFPSKKTAMSFEWWSKRRMRRTEYQELCLDMCQPLHRKLFAFLKPLKKPKFSGLKELLTINLNSDFFEPGVAECVVRFFGVKTNMVALWKITAKMLCALCEF